MGVKFNPLIFSGLDFTGGSGGGSGTVTNVTVTGPYLTVTNPTTTPNISFDPTQIDKLYDGSGDLVIDGTVQQIYQTNANLVIDWGAELIYDGSAVESIDWGGRVLYDSGFNNSVDWDAHHLTDASSTVSVDYAARILYNPSGTNVASWAGSILEATAGLNLASNTINNVAPGVASTDAVNVSQLSAYVPLTEVGAANGVASLDGSGKVPVAQLPSVVMEYQGSWNPNTNTPSLSDGTGTNGSVYWVSAARSTAVAGLTDPSMVNFQIGDLVIYSSSIGKWQLVTPAAGVSSVNGSQGAVTVNAINQLTGDVTAGPASGSASAVATISAGAVTASKLATVTDGITLDQLGSGNTLEIKAGGVSNTQIGASAAIAYTKLAALNASIVPVTNSSGFLTSSTTTTTELGYLDATSSIQTQLNGKQSSGNYITALTGDATASGPGSVPITLATVNSNVGTFTYATVTVNGKGLITAATSGATPQPAGNYITALTGDITASGPGSSAATVAKIQGTTVSGTTGTGDVVFSNTPTILDAILNTPTADTITGIAGGQLLIQSASAENLSLQSGSGNISLGTLTIAQNTIEGSSSSTLLLESGTGQEISFQAANGNVLIENITVTPGTITGPATQLKIQSGSGQTLLLQSQGSGTVDINAGGGLLELAGNNYQLSTNGTTAVTVDTSQNMVITGTITASNFTRKAPTVQQFLSGSGTYTLPSSPAPLYIRVQMCAAGGGGSGSGTSPGNGQTGGATTFGSSFLVTNPGAGGTYGGASAVGGTASIGAGAVGMAMQGGYGEAGSGGTSSTSTVTYTAGGNGGSNGFVGGGAGGAPVTAGIAGLANTGGGGGGGGTNGGYASGWGGAAGGYIDAIIASPSATYAYAIGSGAGTGGAAGGSNGSAGGNGADGQIFVTEYYQ